MTSVDDIATALTGFATVRRLPSGLVAAGTDFPLADGDRVGFFLDERSDGFWLLDDGMTLPLLEAQGVSLQTPTRAQALSNLLDEYGFGHDGETNDLTAGPFSLSELRIAAIRFVSLALRLQDFLLLHPQAVASTFRDDVRRRIEECFAGVAHVTLDAFLAPDLEDVVLDALIVREGHTPVAVVVATTEMRLTEAELIRLAAQVADVPVRVTAVLDRPRPENFSTRSLTRAMNRLAGVLVFGGDGEDAMRGLARLADLPLSAAPGPGLH